MSTFLFDEIIFGPVKSRRLGNSLGINLLPTSVKFCNFNCIYCECGWNQPFAQKPYLPERQQVIELLKSKLIDAHKTNQPIDAITFAGNGEPTIHPDFPAIIHDTIRIRDDFFPHAQIAVLSNAAIIHRPLIREALLKTDRPILKLDSAIEQTFQLINQPQAKLSIEKITHNLEQFQGDFVLQTLFLKGFYNNTPINNTTPEELTAWFKTINQLKPREIMIYTIARDTPTETLEKIPLDKLNEIADRLKKMGFLVQVSG